MGQMMGSPMPQGTAQPMAMGNMTNPTPMVKKAKKPVMAPMHPQMVAAIKASPKGKLPPALAKYLATHKKGNA